jgi:hypothetical protein
MSDYLSRLVSRTLTVARVVQPRVPNRFEPPLPVDDVQLFAVPSGGRAPVTIDRQLIERSDRVIQRSDRESTHDTPTVVKTEESGQPLTPEVRQSVAPLDRSGPPDRDGGLAGKMPPPQEARPIVVVRPRLAPAVASTPHAAPVVRVPSPADQQEVAGPPIEGPATLETPEREGPRTLARRVEKSANRSPAPALPQQSAAPVRETPAKPSITVHIGRIEVRAVTPPPPSPKRPAAPPLAPTLALKDYLKGRRERRR